MESGSEESPSATCEDTERRFFTLVWKIENAGALKNEDNFWGIESPYFNPRSLGERKFRLYMYLKGDDGEGDHLWLLFFQRDIPLDFGKDFEWCFVGGDGSPLYGGSVRNHTMGGMDRLVLPGCPSFEEVFVTRKSEFINQDALTLRFRILKTGGDLSNHEFIFCRSRYELVKDSFPWPISDFSSLELNQEAKIPIRFEFSNGASDFELKLKLKGASLEDSFVGLELTPVTIFSDLKVLLKVSVLDKEEKMVNSNTDMEREYFLPDSKETWIVPFQVFRKELLDKNSDSLRNDTLTLFCEFSATLIECSHSFERKYYGPSNLQTHSLLIQDPER